jgi:hypothetical protein
MASFQRILLCVGVAAMASCDGCSLGCDGSASPDEVTVAATEPGAAADAGGAPDGDSRAGEEACARVVTVAFEGAKGAPEGLARTKEEARARAAALRARVVDQGDDFATVAGAESDHRREMFGALGTVAHGKWPSQYEPIRDAVFALEEGGVTPVVEAPRGYVFAQRCGERAVHVRHILIRHRGAFAAGPQIERSKEEAREEAERLIERVRAGEHMQALAKDYSDDAGSASRGGYLGELKAASVSPEFERVAFSLEPGQLSGVVETNFGYHIIQRLTPAEVQAVQGK